MLVGQTKWHGETHIVSLPVLEGEQKPDPRGIKDMGAKSKDIKGRLGSWRHRDAPVE